MDPLTLQFFPYPHVLGEERGDGFAVHWPERCIKCPDRECERASPGGLEQCRFGVNYQRIDGGFLIAGVVVRNFLPRTDAGSKMVRKVGKQAVTRADFEAVANRAAETADATRRELDAARARVMEDYRNSAGFQTDILELLRPDLQQAFGNVHDYKQFVQQIRQNLEVHVRARFPDVHAEDFGDLIAHASHEERAIYHTAVLMDERLDATLFLLDPEAADAAYRRRAVELHKVVTKYLRIYQAKISEKRLRVREMGGTFAKIEVDPSVVGMIPHALIDNAIKYAPEGGEIQFGFKESAGHVEFAVRSEGPRIHPDEERRIFDVFVQGREAKRAVPGGTGLGLGVAKVVADAVGASLRVSQEAEAGENGGHVTTFTASFDIAPEGPAERERPRRRGGRDVRR